MVKTRFSLNKFDTELYKRQTENVFVVPNALKEMLSWGLSFPTAHRTLRLFFLPQQAQTMAPLLPYLNQSNFCILSTFIYPNVNVH